MGEAEAAPVQHLVRQSFEKVKYAALLLLELAHHRVVDIQSHMAAPLQIRLAGLHPFHETIRRHRPYAAVLARETQTDILAEHAIAQNQLQVFRRMLVHHMRALPAQNRLGPFGQHPRHTHFRRCLADTVIIQQLRPGQHLCLTAEDFLQSPVMAFHLAFPNLLVHHRTSADTVISSD